jgi:hypothetical protein
MYKVYWTNEYGENCGQALDGLTEALALAEWARNSNNTFVTMVSENVNCTSKPGVDTVKDTANYDGWISRGR